MTIEIKHQFVSAEADGPDTSLVRPSNWNDTHTLTQSGAGLLGRDVDTPGDTSELALGPGLIFDPGTYTVSVDFANLDSNYAYATHEHALIDLPEVQTALDEKVNAYSGTLNNATFVDYTEIVATLGSDLDANSLLKVLNPDGVTTGRLTSVTVGKGTNDAGDYGYQYSTTPANRGMYILNIGDTLATGSMFLRKGGNVGIGTILPEYKLDVDGAIRGKGILYLDGISQFTPQIIITNNFDSANAGYINFRKSRSAAIAQVNDSMGTFVGQAQSTDLEWRNASYFSFGINAITTTYVDGNISFSTCQGGSTTVKLTIQSGLQIGSPTGGDKGSGTVNATDYYISNVSITTTLADKVSASTNTTLATGYQLTVPDDGTKSSGTYTPATTGGNIRTAANGGAHTLAEPTATTGYTLIIRYTNVSGAGAITVSGFDKVTGDAFTTTVGHVFFVYITKVGGTSHIHVQAMQ